MHYLQPLLEASDDALVPSVAWSFLGHALARCEKRFHDARAACDRSLATGFSDPENYLNLAWVHLLARQRTSASKALLRGLEVDPRHAGLRELHARLGVRRPPVLAFLPRSNVLNVLLGRIRHALMPAA